MTREDWRPIPGTNGKYEIGLCNWCSSDITRNFRDEDDFCSYGERKEGAE